MFLLSILIRLNFVYSANFFFFFNIYEKTRGWRDLIKCKLCNARCDVQLVHEKGSPKDKIMFQDFFNWPLSVLGVYISSRFSSVRLENYSCVGFVRKFGQQSGWRNVTRVIEAVERDFYKINYSQDLVNLKMRENIVNWY